MGIQIPPWEGAILRGKGRRFAVSCAKTTELIEMPMRFGLRWAQGSMFLVVVHTGET